MCIQASITNDGFSETFILMTGEGAIPQSGLGFGLFPNLVGLNFVSQSSIEFADEDDMVLSSGHRLITAVATVLLLSVVLM